MPRKKQRSGPSASEASVIQVCRVCIESHEVTMSVFEQHNNYYIFQQLIAISNVKMSPGDGLPDRICRPCLAELEAAISFKHKCETSDLYLHGNESNGLVPNITLKIKKEEPDQHEAEYLDINSENYDYEPDNDEEMELEAADTTIEKAEIEEDIYIPLEKHVQCHDCSMIFKSKCKLRVHWKNTHKPKFYTCEICRRVFKKLNIFNKHKKLKPRSCTLVAIEGVRVEGEGKSRVFHCSFCKYSTKRIDYIRTHAVVHNGSKPFACNLCPNKYTQRSALQNHKEQAHGEYLLEITCNYCGKLIRGRQNAYRHLLKHAPKRYQCDLCKKFLKKKKSLIEHLQRHTGVKQKTCEECGEAFYTDSDLCNHKRKHKVGKLKLWVHCELCDYKAVSKSTIEKHQLKHRQYDFVCVTCGLFFEVEQRLRIHERCHLAEKKYECNLCDSRFKQRRHLANHLKRLHKTPLGAIEVIVKQEPPNTNIFKLGT